MKQKSVSNRSLDVLNHDLRSKIYELIKQNDQSTIDIASTLKENRVNLYHHLQMLEKVGLIESYYNNDRMKCFRLPLTRSSKTGLNDGANSNIDSSYEVIVLNPSVDNSILIASKLNELLDALGQKKVLDKSKIVQIQILYQSSSE